MVDRVPYPGRLSNRLKELIERNWPSIRAAADDLECSKSSLQRYVNGENEPSNDLLRRVAERLNLPQSYVFAFDDNPAMPPSAGRRRPEMALVFVPRLDVRAAAGPGVDNDHHAVEENLAFPQWMLAKLGARASSKLRVIRARGDSMEPTFGDGALLLVDEGETEPPQKASPKRHDRDIFVFLHDGALRAKRLRRRGADLLVLSDNRDYDVEIFRGAELKRVEIIGRVIWWDDRL